AGEPAAVREAAREREVDLRNDAGNRQAEPALHVALRGLARLRERQRDADRRLEDEALPRDQVAELDHRVGELRVAVECPAVDVGQLDPEALAEKEEALRPDVPARREGEALRVVRVVAELRPAPEAV